MGGGREERCRQFPAKSPPRVKDWGTRHQKSRRRSGSVHFSEACVLSSSTPIWSPPSWSFLAALTCVFQQEGKKPDRPSSGVLMGGGKGRAGQERGARQTREVGSGEKGGERGARELAALPPWVLGVPLCRQGTSLLVCVLAFVHNSVLCMIFVR